MAIYLPIRHSNIPFLASKQMEDVHFEAISNWEDCDFTQITNWIESKNIKLKDGDVIGFGPQNKLYRNGSKCIWYSNSVHDLEYQIDEYGYIPNVQELQVRPRHFHPRYWSDVITHNGFYWVCDQYRTQCVENIEVIILENSKKIFRTWFEHDENKEYVVYDQDYVNFNILDIHVKEKFIQLLQDKTRPFDWAYFQCQDDVDELMNEQNTSIIHGLDDEEEWETEDEDDEDTVWETDDEDENN